MVILISLKMIVNAAIFDVIIVLKINFNVKVREFDYMMKITMTLIVK